QVDHAARRIISDRRAQDPFDVAEYDAFTPAEALVEEGGLRDDGLAGRDRLGDDSVRDRGSHVLDPRGRGSQRRWPRGHIRMLTVLKLQLPLPRLRDFDDQRERLAEERLGLALTADLQQAPKQTVLTAKSLYILALIGHCFSS